MNDLFFDLLHNTKLKNQSAKIEINISTADVLGTYGCSIKSECVIKTLKSYCEHCGRLREKCDRWCQGDGLHNFKTGYISVASGHGNTPDEAIANVLSTLLKDVSSAAL